MENKKTYYVVAKSLSGDIWTYRTKKLVWSDNHVRFIDNRGKDILLLKDLLISIT